LPSLNSISKEGPLRLVIAGSSGRMGLEIKALALQDAKTWTLAGEISAETQFQINKGAADVLIDFSVPEALPHLVGACSREGVPYVGGTTGLSTTHKQGLVDAAKLVPVFYAANMSLGIAVMQKMMAEMRALKHFDFHIHEIHHIHKKDRPSGTALPLHESLKSAIGRDVEMSVERGGGVFGVHDVRALGPDEVLTLQHQALNRTVFARGSLHAAQWLVSQSPGLYGMADLVK